jgi:hypothetical protein
VNKFTAENMNKVGGRIEIIKLGARGPVASMDMTYVAALGSLVLL